MSNEEGLERINRIEIEVGYIGERRSEQEIDGLERDDFDWMVRMVKEYFNSN